MANALEIRVASMGPFKTNCYLLVEQESGEAMLVDPAGSAEQLAALLGEAAGSVRYIVNTHGHADHIAGNRAAKGLCGAEILIHAADAPLLLDATDVVFRYLGLTEPSPPADRLLRDGDEIRLGNCVFRVLHTPGHTPGSICLLAEDLLLSGDTLFAGSIGRYDLPGGDFDRLMASLEKLVQLDDMVTVYPGHGPKTNIVHEKKTNPHLR
ncbi:MAG: MBL fold metallo-hydrolase [Bacillota bacterium]